MLHPAVRPDDASCEDGLLSQHLQFSDDKPEKKVINSTLKNRWIQKMDHCFCLSGNSDMPGISNTEKCGIVYINLEEAIGICMFKFIQ